MSNKILTFNKLNAPELMEKASSLSPIGSLATTVNKLTYLDIDDAYIHQLFPLLEANKDLINKPAYFGESLAGAHISVIYPEENTFVRNDDLGKKHQFKITGTYTADLGLKRYYVLAIEAESLLSLRNKYSLGRQLCFKEHWIDLHITIGTAPLSTRARKNHVK